MTTKYLGEGKIIEYTNTGAAIASGDVVEMGDKTLGIALGAIAATSGVGSVAIDGEFTVPKTTGTAWAVGDVLDWDTSAGAFDRDVTLGTGDIGDCAICTQTSGSADATGKARLLPGKAVT